MSSIIKHCLHVPTGGVHQHHQAGPPALKHFGEDTRANVIQRVRTSREIIDYGYTTAMRMNTLRQNSAAAIPWLPGLQSCSTSQQHHAIILPFREVGRTKIQLSYSNISWENGDLCRTLVNPFHLNNHIYKNLHFMAVPSSSLHIHILEIWM